MVKCKIDYYDNGRVAYEWYYNEHGFHRENLPACKYYYPNGNIDFEAYYINGEHHREDGPAIICYSSYSKSKTHIISKRYYLYGEEYKDKVIIDNWEKFCKMQIFR